jgi:hypothetical protein
MNNVTTALPFQTHPSTSGVQLDLPNDVKRLIQLGMNNVTTALPFQTHPSTSGVQLDLPNDVKRLIQTNDAWVLSD